MAEIKILTVPNPTLRKKSKKISKIDKKVLNLIKDLREVLKNRKDPMGLGLSAVQIGRLQRVFLAKINGKIETFINPEIVWFSQEKTLGGVKKDRPFLEGCLSVPKYYGEVSRSKKIKIKYTNYSGQQLEKEFSGLQARVIQHECDHLNGILFIDRILEQGSKLYKLTKNELGKEVLEKTSLPFVTK